MTTQSVYTLVVTKHMLTIIEAAFLTNLHIGDLRSHSRRHDLEGLDRGLQFPGQDTGSPSVIRVPQHIHALPFALVEAPVHLFPDIGEKREQKGIGHRHVLHAVVVPPSTIGR